MRIEACVFDAYGTLFDVAAAARRAAQEPGGEALAESWPRLAEIWRLKQLEYSWLRSVADDYRPFWQVTQDALDYAMEAEGTDPGLRETLLGLYRRLDAYPEVPETLRRLRAAGQRLAILSNGSPDMLASAVESAGIGAALETVLSVDAVRVFKPDMRVYRLAEQALDLPRQRIAFFSSNGWDVTHAARYGFRAVWINRAGAPLDRVGQPPAASLPDLSGAPMLVKGAVG